MPGYIYLSPDVFSLERERIFMRGWLCVARTEELPAPGDYLAINVAREPVLVTRNRAGEIRAFSNMCAHRGAQIASGSGNVVRFSCPYHGWSYDLDGRLTGASYMADAAGFSRESCRLPPLQVTESQGWIFVNFDETAAPFEPSSANSPSESNTSLAEDGRLATRFELDFDCNWKVLIEQVLLKSLTSRRRGATASLVRSDQHGSISSVPASAMPAPQQPGSHRDGEERSAGKDEIATVAYMDPNACSVTRTDHHVRLISWPSSPQKSRLAVYLLCPEAVHGAPGFAERAQSYEAQLRDWLTKDTTAGNPDGGLEQLDAALGRSVRHYFERVFS